jgi:hypothetical protein
MRYRDEITFTISMLTLIYSTLMMIRLRVRSRRKVRVSAYNEELMRIATLVQQRPPLSVLQGCRADLNALIQRVMRDFAAERISDGGFQVFSLTWEAVRASISEAMAEARFDAVAQDNQALPAVG